MNATATPRSPCPDCGAGLDRATETRPGAVPRPGDVSICMHCNAVNVFAEDLTVRRPTAAEAAGLRQSPAVGRALAMLIRAKRELSRR